MTFLSVAGYWRQVPNVPEAVKAFVDVQQASPSFAPPPPALPGRVPLDVKGPVDLACRAAKQAWLIEAKRAQFTGEEVSDERLNNLTSKGGSGMPGTPTIPMCVHRDEPLPQAAPAPCAFTCCARASCEADEVVRERKSEAKLRRSACPRLASMALAPLVMKFSWRA